MKLWGTLEVIPLKIHIHSYVRTRRWVWALMRRMSDGRYSYWDQGWSNDENDFAWEAI